MNSPGAARAHILATLFTCAAIALCHAACARAVNPHDLQHPFIGKAAPEITVEPLGGEGPKTLAEALGKVVIVDFWASWCGPCKEALPIYRTIADKFPDEVAVIAIDTDEPGSKTKAELLAFARESHTKFSIVWDKDGSVLATYRVSGLPTTFILDRSGTVRHVHRGYRAGDAQILTREVARSRERRRGCPAGRPFRRGLHASSGDVLRASIPAASASSSARSMRRTRRRSGGAP
ncbi:MAG: TlpA disulfide reductase family protein [Minicystis sp.]